MYDKTELWNLHKDIKFPCESTCGVLFARCFNVKYCVYLLPKLKHPLCGYLYISCYMLSVNVLIYNRVIYIYIYMLYTLCENNYIRHIRCLHISWTYEWYIMPRFVSSGFKLSLLHW